MHTADFTKTASDGKTIYVHRWVPDVPSRAMLLVAHGMAEHGLRYVHLARAMTAASWSVYAPDHRGHGKTAESSELGWFAERDGFGRVVDDLREVADQARAEQPGLPLFVLGHCMGSLIALALAGLHGEIFSGCVLAGVLAEPTAAQLAAGKLISAAGCLFNAQVKSAPLLDRLTVGTKNRGFEPARTAYEWLSRDREEVDSYAADPLCGFVCSYGFFRDLFAGLDLVYGPGGCSDRASPGLPFYLVAGDADAMGGARGSVQALGTRLRSAGAVDVETRLYPGARHALLSETNRDEIMLDLRRWLDLRARTPRRERVETASGGER
jgi:alpha-beta hydrolase superfamily lysophospholipase